MQIGMRSNAFRLSHRILCTGEGCQLYFFRSHSTPHSLDSLFVWIVCFCVRVSVCIGWFNCRAAKSQEENKRFCSGFARFWLALCSLSLSISQRSHSRICHEHTHTQRHTIYATPLRSISFLAVRIGHRNTTVHNSNASCSAHPHTLTIHIHTRNSVPAHWLLEPCHSATHSVHSRFATRYDVCVCVWQVWWISCSGCWSCLFPSLRIVFGIIFDDRRWRRPTGNTLPLPCCIRSVVDGVLTIVQVSDVLLT